MIFFINDNSGILFIKGVIRKVVENIVLISNMVRSITVKSWMS